MSKPHKTRERCVASAQGKGGPPYSGGKREIGHLQTCNLTRLETVSGRTSVKELSLDRQGETRSWNNL